ncbi:exonuclease/endonuclease/phosphatase family protein [Rufibacter roseus]|uniref:Endonuclease/exonuclease/phosphatase family protein n=1 Tax=Rufibacter roseus TaxID=1567108 RepID=A0ABW2DNZ7_9BACT|nr:hypothetical protein [Rufibacter roseus]
MNIGFWNINKRKPTDIIYDFATLYDLDILILAESPYSPPDLLRDLNRTTSDYYYSPGFVCDKLQFYTKFKPAVFQLVHETNRVSGRRLFSTKHGEILLIALHFNSKVNWTNEDQAAESSNLKAIIEYIENKVRHQRTVICGDFNMNPFDFGMVQNMGLHSVMDKKIATKGSRIINGHEYHYFYNPMWSFFGDNGKGSVSGSMYYSPAKPINYHWHLYDQVLIRPGLIPDFDENELDIVCKIGATELLTKESLVKRRISDHLPIKFKLLI